MANLAELTALSTTLNQQSNRVNDLLKELEGKLYAMNLGVEVWAYDAPLSRTPKAWYDPDKDREYRESRDLVLGWARFGEKYGLTVQSVTYRWEGKWVMTDEGPRTPLLQATREARIAALDKIDVLIEALTEQAREVVNSIQKAQQTIEKL
jgi:uncharacterized protein YukE